MDTKKREIVAAIDVGTTKIVALLGERKENGKVEIIGFTRYDSKGIRRGEVLNPEEASTVVRDSIVDLQQRTGFLFSEIFVGIAGQHIRFLKTRKGFNRPSYEDSITANDVEQLMLDANNIALEEGKEILHILPQSYIVDNETDIFNPIGMMGRRLEANFNIVIGNTDSMKRIRKAIGQTDMDIKIKQMVLEPLASAEAVLYDEEREAGVALIDIGGGTTDLVVFHNNILRHTAVFPFGGFAVTKDIKTACGLNEQVAEEVKLQFGMAIADKAEDNLVIVIPAKIRDRESKEISIKNLALIIQSRMNEIIDGIMFEIENSGYADKLGYGIVITGGGAMLKHLKELFKFRTGMDVRVGYPGEHLTGNVDTINETCYATGVGLLMKGFDYMDNHRNEMAEVRFVQNIADADKETSTETKVEEAEAADVDVEKKKKKIKEKKSGTPLLERFKDSLSKYFSDVVPESGM